MLLFLFKNKKYTKLCLLVNLDLFLCASVNKLINEPRIQLPLNS